MSHKYKSKISIIFSILEACIDGKRRSHMISKFALSHSKFKFYSDFLLEKGFLFIDDGGLMKVTKKGKSFLERLMN
ncbi:MAG TPA: winged helix-turn-helix domain-containing protein [Nitrososphaeraceae archaeon]|nr:winged helix-turn-helix domain-containing protein [Nitrososphaeraceae archaeon]HSF49260.1 winged helix-turn-helix domain-containing protein [Nitrososphaeraceae archaeon]